MSKVCRNGSGGRVSTIVVILEWFVLLLRNWMISLIGVCANSDRNVLLNLVVLWANVRN